MKPHRQQYQQQLRPKKNTLVINYPNVLQALQTGIALDKIMIDQTLSEKNYAQLFAQAEKQNVPIQKVPQAKLNNLNIGEHDGCIATLSKITYYNLQDVIDQTVTAGHTPLFVILDGITDIRNIGGIARSAYAMGVHALIIPSKGVGALNEDAILTSAGALEKLAVCRVPSLMKAVDTLHLNGITVFASEMTATTTLQQLNLTQPSAIIMGGEENGVYPALLKICDAQFNIPMHNQFESLNVSVATGIILYEAQQQLSKLKMEHSKPKN